MMGKEEGRRKYLKQHTLEMKTKRDHEKKHAERKKIKEEERETKQKENKYLTQTRTDSKKRNVGIRNKVKECVGRDGDESNMSKERET